MTLPIAPAARRRELAALTSRHQRKKRGELVLEGPRLVSALLSVADDEAAWRMDYVVVADEAAHDAVMVDVIQQATRANIDVFGAAAADMAAWCSTATPQGVIAVAAPRELPPLVDVLRRSSPFSPCRVLVLDGVQDPGNVGTLIRSAAALGVGGVALCKGCADLTNPRVLRATMGGAFSLPVFSRVERDELLTAFGTASVPLVVADLDGEPFRTMQWPDAFALALGAEVAGPSSVLRGHAAHVVGIPQRPHPQSLNVAMAGAILLAHVVSG